MWCWSRGRGISRKLSLYHSIVYYYNGAQRYEQFLQVDQLCRALILLGLALCLLCVSVSLVFTVLYTYIFFLNLLTSFSLPFSELNLVGLTWLTNHHPSVLWRCWLGHLTRNIVAKMTFTVHHTVPYQKSRLWWLGHVICEEDADWVMHCLTMAADGIRQSGCLR